MPRAVARGRRRPCGEVVFVGEAEIVRRTLGPFLGILLLSLPASPSRAGDEPGRALDTFFKGRITRFDAKTLTLHYDFSKKEQMEDWPAGIPFPIEKLPDQDVRWFDERLEVRGNTGAGHLAVWRGDIEVRCHITPDAEKDLGGYLVPSPESDDLATFTLAETYFHGWDKHSGGQLSILKFGKQWRERGSSADFIGFRYVADRPLDPPMQVGHAVDMMYGIKGGKLVLQVGDVDLAGRDIGTKFKNERPGFYTVKGRMLVDDVDITGRLDPAWMKAHDLAWRLETPLTAVAADPEAEKAIEAYGKGQAAAADIVKIVGDLSRPEPVRQAAAEALGKGPKKAVPATLDLLYHADPDVRSLGIGIVKALLGKDYGYKATGSESSRSVAIRRLNEDLKDHPELLSD